MIRTLSAFCCGCLLTAIIVLFIFSGECEKEALSFRVTPQGSFPGFHIQSYEFSIPLNRMELTALVHADDPEGFYGSGGAPMTIIVFRVKENGEFHYFALSGAQESRISEFQYLGKELELKNWAPAGAGFLKLDFFRSPGHPQRMRQENRLLWILAGSTRIPMINMLLKENLFLYFLQNFRKVSAERIEKQSRG